MSNTRYSEVNNKIPQHVELLGLMFYGMHIATYMLLTGISKVIYL